MLFQDRDTSLELLTDRRHFDSKFEVIPSSVDSSNPWVPIIPTPTPTTRSFAPLGGSVRPNSLSVKAHRPRSRDEISLKIPKRQQYQSRPPQKLKSVRPKKLPKKHVKLVLEKTKPLINFLPKRTPTNRFFPPRSRALRPQSQSKPKRFVSKKCFNLNIIST